MPTKVMVEVRFGLVRICVNGPTDFRTLSGAIRGLATDPDFKPQDAILLDLRGMEYIPDDVEARLLAEQLCHLQVFGSRLAILVDLVVAFGVMRMINVLCRLRGNEVLAFADPAKAEIWLGLPAALDEETAETGSRPASLESPRSSERPAANTRLPGE